MRNEKDLILLVSCTLCLFLCSGFTSLKTLPMGIISAGDVHMGKVEPPRGLAVKSASVCVARRWSPQIEIFGIDSNLAVIERKTYSVASSWRTDDLAASFRDSIVYLLGSMVSNQHMVVALCCSSGNIVASWPVVKMPYRLSVDSQTNSVLLACRDGLRSYSSCGLLNYFVPVKVKANSVWHAVPVPFESSCSDDNRYNIVVNCLYFVLEFLLCFVGLLGVPWA